ncbi:dihydroxyacetone kinase subunit DhaL [Planomonospora sp. ID82291]|uniref:dihydroxyacetone kinase subunit DhaL n=1 Tax=Planomonospora sp. ID82291 TaxID=2738136 RepID=UPI0018C3F7EF|nr:dihydroxyacetone kinase subunit DhaL [Planomonospora sp. ID82291]MBG0817520.1 dihydroxyacetone kinase subunit L [Planomonospora sp. ID82291]
MAPEPPGTPGTPGTPTAPGTAAPQRTQGPQGTQGPPLGTGFFAAWIEEAARSVRAGKDRLTRLDTAIGDGDHGTNLDRGLTAAVQVLADRPPASPGALLVLVGGTLIRKVGGASGPLYGTAFREAGKALGEEPAVSPGALAGALEAAVDGVRRLGSAVEGDKTMVDALAPAVRALAQAVREGREVPEALEAAASAARNGAEATVPMQARKGRASYLGPRSVGHQDPGAASAALLVAALRTVAARW